MNFKDQYTIFLGYNFANS